MLKTILGWLLLIGVVVVIVILAATPFFNGEEDCGWDDDAHKGE